MTPNPRLAGFVLCLTLFGASVAPSAAQPARLQPPQQPRELAPELYLRGPGTDAQTTRDQLRDVLQRFPPSVAQVLRLDPSLLTQPSYLATYPELAAYLSQHPEIAHNPAFFFGASGRELFDPQGPQERISRGWQNVLQGFAFLVGFVTVVGAVSWLLRSVIEHRRWLRLSKVQVDTHTKVMDRLQSNEDLLAYIQTPAGRRFLEGAPIPVDVGSRAIGAPIGRILWSVQAGLVLAAGGLGLQFVSGRVIEEVGPGLWVIGVVAFALGGGFVLSAVFAYIVSRRLGLFEPINVRAGAAGEGPPSQP